MTTLAHDERLGLWLLLGRRVHGTATRTGKHRQWGQRLTLLRDVALDEGVEAEHLWTELTPYAERLVPVGARFRFEAVVRQYQRVMAGTESCTLAQVRVVSVEG